MSLGKEFAKDLENPLSSPHAREPIMRNGDLHDRNHSIRKSLQEQVTGPMYF
jgi:hypothetical protein